MGNKARFVAAGQAEAGPVKKWSRRRRGGWQPGGRMMDPALVDGGKSEAGGDEVSCSRAGAS
jgi:hypothetical protein